jgi:hypothetical protein
MGPTPQALRVEGHTKDEASSPAPHPGDPLNAAPDSGHAADLGPDDAADRRPEAGPARGFGAAGPVIAASAPATISSGA